MERLTYVAERVRCRRHRKVFSGENFPHLDRWFWICTECHEAGSDKLAQDPETDPKLYWQTMRRLKPDCWVPAKYNKIIL